MFLSSPSHAAGLFGAPGSGKDYLAWNMTAQLLGISIEQAKNHPQIFVIDVEIDGGIEKVRELQVFLSLKVPGKANIRRCVIIRQTEKLSHPAQNALLKTLEEPPADTVIICTLCGNGTLLPTISSRLQKISVLPLSYDQAAASFAAFTKAQIQRAYHISEGNVGLMCALLENSDEHPMSVAITQAKAILQESSYMRLVEIGNIAKDKNQNIPDLLDAVYKLLHAATLASVRQVQPNQPGIVKLNQQVANVLRAQELLNSKVQAKLVLTWLFYSL